MPRRKLVIKREKHGKFVLFIRVAGPERLYMYIGTDQDPTFLMDPDPNCSYINKFLARFNKEGCGSMLSYMDPDLQYTVVKTT